MLNFISIRIFERFFNENLNFINNSFKIKYCSFKKKGGYWKKRPGPARFVKPGIYNPDLKILPDLQRFVYLTRAE